MRLETAAAVVGLGVSVVLLDPSRVTAVDGLATSIPGCSLGIDAILASRRTGGDNCFRHHVVPSISNDGDGDRLFSTRLSASIRGDGEEYIDAVVEEKTAGLSVNEGDEDNMSVRVIAVVYYYYYVVGNMLSSQSLCHQLLRMTLYTFSTRSHSSLTTKPPCVGERTQAGRV